MTKVYTKNPSARISARRNLLRTGSAAALAVMISSTALAQTSEDDVEEIVVTGIRSSLENSQSIKRDADTFVDSITASDIGALPDRSVLEAIQRVPGVSITRFAAADDPDHFSVEGSGVVIRGLSYVRSEFNGRDAFSAGNERGLGFEDVPPELVGGVDVFKNQTADMVEGGISGVVNLRTLKPFDRSGQTFSISADATYTDLAEETSPSISALYTNRWDTAAGEFGFLASGSFSNLKSRSDGFQLGAVYPYDRDAFELQRPQPAFTGLPSTAPTGVAADTIAGFPEATIRTQNFDRDRFGVTLSGQWASNDGKSLATAEFIRSESNNVWNERSLETEGDPPFRRNDTYATGDLTILPFTSEGILTDRDNTTRVPVTGGRFGSGILTSDAEGWNGRYGLRQTGLTRVSDTESITSDYSLNYKYTPNDSWKFNFDAQYVDATTKNSDITAHGATYLDVFLDVTDTSSPIVEYLVSTVEGNRQPNASRNADGTANREVDDPSEVYFRAAMDHFEDSEADEFSFRGDVEHEFDSDGWFQSVRVGGRYAERNQLTRWSEYNWGNVSDSWNGGATFFDTLPDGITESYTFDNFQRGDTLRGANTFLFPALSLVSDYDALTAFTATQPGGWTPSNGNFAPSEISNTTEETTAVYARVDFGNDEFVSDGGMTVEGNYGLRVVHTDISSTGGAQFIPDAGIACTGNGGNPYPGVVEECAILAQAPTEISGGSDETHVLPSFNLKVEVKDNVIARFAASKAISRPQTGLLRAYRNTRGDFSLIRDNMNNVTGATFNRFTQTGGNPDLKPVEAINFDASLEWYFNSVGSVTASLFYKDLDDIIIGTNSGQTGSPAIAATTSAGIPFEGAINNGSGTVQGYEIAYQQFYDFLPSFWSGFGVQANYTFVEQSAIPNGGVDANRGGEAQNSPRFTVTDLESLSEHTVNLIGLYENDKFEGRLAYNWRSDYLLTTSDVITRLPVYVEQGGQLDASFKYNVTDQFQIGVQGVNLLSEITETQVQADDAGTRLTRSLFENDRRISLTGRYKF